MTTIIGNAFFSAIRLSSTRFARPAMVQPEARSLLPWKR
jgi:hypothetical protein